MARYTLVVYTNPVEGREEEFNTWYDGRHLGDVLKVPGAVAARRLEQSPQQLAAVPQTHRYLALYELDTDNIKLFLDEFARRANTELMPISSALAPGTAAVLWKTLGD